MKQEQTSDVDVQIFTWFSAGVDFLSRWTSWAEEDVLLVWNQLTFIPTSHDPVADEEPPGGQFGSCVTPDVSGERTRLNVNTWTGDESSGDLVTSILIWINQPSHRLQGLLQ